MRPKLSGCRGGKVAYYASGAHEVPRTVLRACKGWEVERSRRGVRGCRAARELASTQVALEPRPTHPYVAPHTAKFHTLTTLGIRNRTKPLVRKARKRRPCGFDSHRPLQFQQSLANASQ